MRIINETINENLQENNIDLDFLDFYFQNLKWATFDIETTGLSPKSSLLILSGFTMKDSNENLSMIQVFSEGGDEFDVITKTLEILSEVDYIITFNGASFDLPFLIERAKALGIEHKPLPYNLDIYKLIKSFSEINKFTPNLKQKTIENFMGIWIHRGDEISGAESIELYSQYLETKREDILEKILLHNSDDVKQLYRLIPTLKHIQLHRAMSVYGFPQKSFSVESIKLTKSKLIVKGLQEELNYHSYMDEQGILIDFSKPHYEIIINLIYHEDVIFADLDRIGLNIYDFENSMGLSGHYLVLSHKEKVNHLAINLLAMNITKTLLDKLSK